MRNILIIFATIYSLISCSEDPVSYNSSYFEGYWIWDNYGNPTVINLLPTENSLWFKNDLYEGDFNTKGFHGWCAIKGVKDILYKDEIFLLVSGHNKIFCTITEYTYKSDTLFNTSKDYHVFTR